jgi:hypothetical protein
LEIVVCTSCAASWSPELSASLQIPSLCVDIYDNFIGHLGERFPLRKTASYLAIPVRTLAASWIGSVVPVYTLAGLKLYRTK